MNLRIAVRKVGITAAFLSITFTVLASFILGNYSAKALDFKGLLISPATDKFDIAGGETHSGKLKVISYSDQYIPVRMTVTSYSIRIADKNSPSYTANDRLNVMQNWVKLDNTNFTLSPGEPKYVSYRVEAPSSIPGITQYAVIFAETSGKDGATSRVGEILAASPIEGKTVEHVKFDSNSIPSIVYDGKIKKSVNIINDGNVGSNIELKVSIYSGNKEVYQQVLQNDRIFMPGESQEYDINKDKLPLGQYRLEQALTVNGVKKMTTNTFMVIPIWLIILSIVALIGIIISIFIAIGRIGSRG